MDKYHTAGKRIWAAIVDGIVFMPLMLLDNWMQQTGSGPIVFGWATLYLLGPVLYSIIMHYRTGQTIGKWVAGIRVVDISECKNLSLKQSIARDSVYLLIALITLSYYAIKAVGADSAEEEIGSFLSISDNLMMIWALAEIITMFTNEKRRAIHDYLAQSVVVRVTQTTAIAKGTAPARQN